MASEWLKLTAYLSDVFAVSHQNTQAGCDHVNPYIPKQTPEEDKSGRWHSPG